jgi:subtilisin family serine protease
MMWRRKIANALVLAAVLATATPSAATAQPIDARKDASAKPISVRTRDPADAAKTAALVDRARTSRRGRIRVIVRLDLSMRDEGTLSAAEQAAQSRVLATVQNDVLRRSLPGVAARRVVRFEFIPFMSVLVSASQLQRLIADPSVVAVAEDIPIRPLLNGSTVKIQARKLWQKRIDGRGTVIAVLDSGVDANHNMLLDKIVAEACFSSIDPPTEESLCPGGVAKKIGRGAGRHCPLGLDGCEHGTHVASIAAGWSPDLRGVAYRADIISVQIFTKFTDPEVCGSQRPCISSNTTDQILALEQVFRWHWRNQHKIAAVNMSAGGEYLVNCDAWETGLTDIIAKLRGAGIPTVIAAGNDGRNGQVVYPACISGAIAVASSTTATDVVAWNSNLGPQVKLLAPGVAIAAAKAGTSNGVAVFSGTSQAAPHVAGAFAMLRQAKRDATLDDILAALECTGRPIKRARGYDLKKPRIRLLNALRYLRRPPTMEQRWDFDRPGDEDDWEALSGTWKIVNKQWILRRSDNFWNISWHPSCAEALEITAYMQVVNRTKYGSYSGLLLRGDIDEKTKYVTGYRFFFGWHDDSDWAIIARADNEYLGGSIHQSNQLCRRYFGSCSGCERGFVVNRNGYNRVKVISSGGNHRFYLNRKLVCTATDATYASGAIGLITNHWLEPRKQGFRVKWIEVKPLGDSSSAPGIATLPR